MCRNPFAHRTATNSDVSVHLHMLKHTGEHIQPSFLLCQEVSHPPSWLHVMRANEKILRCPAVEHITRTKAPGLWIVSPADSQGASSGQPTTPFLPSDCKASGAASPSYTCEGR